MIAFLLFIVIVYAQCDTDCVKSSYKVIHTHTYPTWNSFENFTKLPGFKYFDAQYNYSQYWKSENITGEYLGVEYTFKRKLVSNYSYYVCNSQYSTPYYEMDLDMYMSYRGGMTQPDKDYLSNLINRTIRYTIFNNSESDVYKNKTFGYIKPIVFEYFYQYARGYMFVNYADFIFRKPVYQLFVTNGTAKLVIRALKKISLIDTNNYHISSDKGDNCFCGCSGNLFGYINCINYPIDNLGNNDYCGKTYAVNSTMNNVLTLSTNLYYYVSISYVEVDEKIIFYVQY